VVFSSRDEQDIKSHKVPMKPISQSHGPGKPWLCVWPCLCYNVPPLPPLITHSVTSHRSLTNVSSHRLRVHKMISWNCGVCLLRKKRSRWHMMQVEITHQKKTATLDFWCVAHLTPSFFWTQPCYRLSANRCCYLRGYNCVFLTLEMRQSIGITYLNEVLISS